MHSSSSWSPWSTMSTPLATALLITFFQAQCARTLAPRECAVVDHRASSSCESRCAPASSGTAWPPRQEHLDHARAALDLLAHQRLRNSSAPVANTLRALVAELPPLLLGVGVVADRVEAAARRAAGAAPRSGRPGSRARARRRWSPAFAPDDTMPVMPQCSAVSRFSRAGEREPVLGLLDAERLGLDRDVVVRGVEVREISPGISVLPSRSTTRSPGCAATLAVADRSGSSRPRRPRWSPGAAGLSPSSRFAPRKMMRAMDPPGRCQSTPSAAGRRRAARLVSSRAASCCRSFTSSKPRTCSGRLAISTASRRFSGERPSSSSSSVASYSRDQPPLEAAVRSPAERIEGRAAQEA